MTKRTDDRPEAARRDLGPLGVVLGYGPIVPLVAAAVIAPLAPAP